MDQSSGRRPSEVEQLRSTEEDDKPACQSCRKRKLKCSREIPSCTQCLRLSIECVYDPRRQKPGIKTGAIESLNKRLELLESILLDSNGKQKVLLTSPPSSQDYDQHGASPISKSVASLNSSSNHDEGLPSSHMSASNTSGTLHQTSRSVATDSPHQYSHSGLPKKRRLPDDGVDNYGTTSDVGDLNSIVSSLPSQQLLEAIIDTYFVKVHPWIPMIHELRLRARLENPDDLRLAVLLHAIVFAAIRHVNLEEFGINPIAMDLIVQKSRNVVMLNAMDDLSVENLQALIILAFHFMGSGQVSKAWSIIGSLTRTVEYLQLTVEPGESEKNCLLQPFTLLDEARDFREAEERRRVFWNIFLLDRFCSVTSGWGTSLTSDDVRRQLPSEGGMWHRGEPVETPYFGIWSKSAAKIGNSIAYIPAHYQPQSDHGNANSGENTAFVDVDRSKIGALAYRIEATESLSQVTSFFLQQHVDFKNRQEVGSWLTRFKELDLRLVHWKMFLPQRWKDSNVSHDISLIKMDPNLTVAHLSHNASTILLHQHIAYPPGEWSSAFKLPSACSAETCLLAAVEMASITQKYLRYTEGGIITGQLAFCIFIAARILLVHWRYYNAILSPEFFNLIESLQEISRRWKGYSEPQTPDLAAQYALHLQKLHQKSLENVNYYLQILGYGKTANKPKSGGLLPSFALSDDKASPLSPIRINTSNPIRDNITHRSFGSNSSEAGSESGTKFLSSQLPYAVQSPLAAPKPPDFSFPYNYQQQNQITQSESSGNMSLMNMGVDDELTAMSHILLGQQFLEMDRVITFDGADFNLDLNAWENTMP